MLQYDLWVQARGKYWSFCAMGELDSLAHSRPCVRGGWPPALANNLVHPRASSRGSFCGTSLVALAVNLVHPRDQLGGGHGLGYAVRG